MKCANCGSKVKKGTKFCNNCGAEIVVEETQNEKNENSVNGLSKKMILIGVAIVVGVALIASVVTGIVVKNIDRNTMKNGKVTLKKLEKKLNNTKVELNEKEQRLKEVNAQVKGQEKKIKPLKDIYDKSLAPGEYKVGSDLEPGIYHFKYKLKKKDAWGGDYIYVTHAGSKGKEETLGGTKYDFREEGSDDGEEVSIKLVSGDSVLVETDMGGAFEPAKN